MQLADEGRWLTVNIGYRLTILELVRVGIFIPRAAEASKKEAFRTIASVKLAMSTW
jgi:hypothetical protein